MMIKAYFCWEKNFAGQWTPCVYYNDKPSYKGENARNVEHTAAQEFEIEERGGPPDLVALSLKWPAPEISKEETNV